MKMKNVVYLFVALCSFFFTQVNAQLKTPASSQFAKFETTVGLTPISIEYSRPSKKNRVIYGGLVPYDAKWRTGANMNTKVTFGDDVVIGGKELKKGTYALYTKPGKDMWEIYFYTDTNNGGLPSEWDDAKVALTTTAKPYAVSNVETFTIDINNVTNNSGDITILWETTGVNIKVEVPTDKIVSANIDKVMNGPTANDYYNAAKYYREAGKDLKMALEWMNRAVQMGYNQFWVLNQKALIESDLGKYKDAIVSASQSLEKAKAAGNNDYVKMNQDLIQECTAKLKK